MRLGIVGTGNVGCAIAFAAVMRGSAREILLVNRTSKTAEAVATDIRYGTPLGPKVDIKCGSYEALSGADVVLITSGVNEKTGGATDRNDPQGRLRLLEKNAKIYREIVPQIVHAAPKAVLVAVTDPPDPLADIARETSGHDRVLSTGTFLDTLSCTPRKALWRQSRMRGSASDRRPRDGTGISVVVRTHCRRSGLGTPKGAQGKHG